MDSWNSLSSNDLWLFSDHIPGIIHADAAGKFVSMLSAPAGVALLSLLTQEEAESKPQ